MQMQPPPKTITELLERCQTISGRTLGDLAECSPYSLPKKLINNKGWIGQLIEWHLGAHSQQLPQPDFLHLGIELKTVPVSKMGEPQESTYVCTAPFHPSALAETWEHSRVRAKLQRVLWVPVETATPIGVTKANPSSKSTLGLVKAELGLTKSTLGLAERRVGTPYLWIMDTQTEFLLKQDWEELMEMLMLGQFSHISARFGTYLHIRPKAAHSRILQASFDETGEPIKTGPKGFYLRTSFTRTILHGIMKNQGIKKDRPEGF